jgi:hypothetical protein
MTIGGTSRFCNCCEKLTWHTIKSGAGCTVYICMSCEKRAINVAQSELFPAIDSKTIPLFEHNEMPIQARKVGDY